MNQAKYFQNSLWKCSWKKKCETSVYVFAPGRLKVIEQHYGYLKICIQISWVAQSCPTLRDPMDCSMPGLPIHHQLPEFTQTHVLESVMPSNHLILCRPLILLPSTILSIRVFSNESFLHVRWPKYWSFRFSINPSNEYIGLISFRIDWFDLFSVQGTLKSLL